jgi:hypothetical protein
MRSDSERGRPRNGAPARGWARGVVAMLSLTGLAAWAGQPPPFLAPDSVEGTLWAAECLALPVPAEACNLQALSAAKPGGVLAAKGFTLLLLDSRLLLRTCVAQHGQGRLRASGLLHEGSTAMTVFRLEEDCGAGWQVVDLPYSGVSGGGAEGGDE